MPASDDRPTPPVEQMLAAMDSWGASDLFVCGGKVPAVRLHGGVVALEVGKTPEDELERFIKLACNEKRLARMRSDGGVEVAYSLPSGARFRLSIARQLGATQLCARALPKAQRSLEELALPASLASFTERSRGLVLIAGAPGSGRSTTLAALVHHINVHRPVHITTLEDPVEILHVEVRARVTQREVGTDTPSCAAGARRAMLEGADVLVLAQLTSHEAARAALEAAQSGQLVLAVLNAADATRAMSLFVGLFPAEERPRAAVDLAAVLVGATAQRLLPRRDGAGRVAAVEVLGATHEVTRLIREQAWDELDELVLQEQTPGILCFDAALEALCRTTLIAPEACVSQASNTEGFVRRLRGTSAISPELARYVGLDLQSLLALVVKRGASDLHLSVGRPPALRVDGRLESQPTPPIPGTDLDALLRSITSTQQRAALARDRELDFSFAFTEGRRFRVNAYHERGNLAIAFRSISSRIPDAEALGLPPAVLRMGEEPHGLLLVVGPTGSGKTTTLACLTDRINHTRPCHIITIEDPIEYVHKSDRATIHQREVGTDTDSFARALKYILRQDPDVVLIGELRDFETVSAALTAAETGHLVLATLHTNDAVQTIDRVIDVFPPHQQGQARAQLSAALIGVVSQRLLPKADGVGRLAAFEVMVATPAIRTLVREAKMHQALGIMQTSRTTGMLTMEQSLEELLRRGSIDKEEALRYMLSAGSSDRSRSKHAASPALQSQPEAAEPMKPRKPA